MLERDAEPQGQNAGGWATESREVHEMPASSGSVSASIAAMVRGGRRGTHREGER